MTLLFLIALQPAPSVPTTDYDALRVTLDVQPRLRVTLTVKP